MGRLSKSRWEDARVFYEVGGSLRTTALKFGVSHVAVKKAADREGWAQNFEEVIRREVAAKVTGIVTAETAEKRAAAIEVEADRRVKVSERHVKLAEQATALQQQAICHINGRFKPNIEELKAAKMNADTITLLITLERKIHRLEDAQPNQEPAKIVFVRYDG